MQQRARIAAQAPQKHFAELVVLAAAVVPLHAHAGALTVILHHHSSGISLWASSGRLQQGPQIVAAMLAAVQLVAARWPNS